MNTLTLAHTGMLHAAPACFPDEPCFVIGDVHGHLTELSQALQFAEQRLNEGECARVVLLGDLIDCGPRSADCLRLAAQFRAKHEGRVDLLAGNHEQMMLAAIYGADERTRRDAYSNWWRTGGDAEYPDELALERRRQLLEGLGLGPDGWLSHARNGNCLFVHAGVPAGMDAPLLEQFLAQPLLRLPRGSGASFPHWAWIRNGFLEASEPCAGYFVVHGHTPWDFTSAPRKGRLNLDGGAKKYGRVSTALLRPGLVELTTFAPAPAGHDAE